ncbi:MAG: hypothetical protein QM817_28185 [Archangium sp.]
MRALLFAVAATSMFSCGGGASRPCTFTLSGAVTASEACTSMNTKAMAIATASELNWLVSLDNAMVQANITFQLPKPLQAGTYTGGADTPWCTALVTTKDAMMKSRSATSRPQMGTGQPLGNCSITFTSVVEDSSKSTTSYVVGGSAQAHAINTGDGSSVDIAITF